MEDGPPSSTKTNMASFCANMRANMRANAANMANLGVPPRPRRASVLFPR